MMISNNQNRVTIINGDMRCTLDKSTGQPAHFQGQKMVMGETEIYIDVGCNGDTETDLLKFDCLDKKRTWELPVIQPAEGKGWTFTGCGEDGDIVYATYKTRNLEISVNYRLIPGNICINADIKNISGRKQIINGVAFIVKNNSANETTTFEFPGNVPYKEFSFKDMKEGSVIETGLVNPVIHSCTNENHINILFLDDQEKWGTGVYKHGQNQINFVNFAAVETYLNPDEKLRCGTLYIQLIGKQNPYLPVRELYKYLGYKCANNGIFDGVVYSCHPSGTMDADFPYTSGCMGDDFPYNGSMYEYTAELDRLKEMGVDHVWILPIFQHLNRGVYSPTDQAIIDKRYGGDEAVKHFCDKAHKLGMTVLFDYVPHGPEIEDPLAKEHMEWCSVDRDGKQQTEWDCVSFDMANPDYQDYTRRLVRDHVRRFGIDGARIDCAMGGLTNWKPYDGNRPSNSNLKGGVAISRSIREALLEEGKTPIVTPENFNPLPFYYAYTDIFYDMPLYRVLYELGESHLSPEQFAYNLTRWLNGELLTTPEGHHKMRFLGNHDTVSWVFQKARAPKVYGINKAKALWVLISLIDGMPMLYQGDEDPKLYKGDGPELRGFFKELFTARKRYLGNNYSMEYEFTGSPIMAFNRSFNELKRKVLINMSPDKTSYPVAFSIKNILYGSCEINSKDIVLDGYGYVLLDID